MRYHLFQKIFEKVVKIKETSFLLSKCLVSIGQHCKSLQFFYMKKVFITFMIVARKSSKLKSDELHGGCAIIGIISLERKNYVKKIMM